MHDTGHVDIRLRQSLTSSEKRAGLLLIAIAIVLGLVFYWIVAAAMDNASCSVVRPERALADARAV